LTPLFLSLSTTCTCAIVHPTFQSGHNSLCSFSDAHLSNLTHVRITPQLFWNKTVLRTRSSVPLL
jgi:hypothetical protein